MFCPKCGIQNPENGKFCRSCGSDLGNISLALSGKLTPPENPVDRRGRAVTWESAITKIFMGLAFLLVSFILGFSRMGRGWWFWMLIPAFLMLGRGVAQYIQLKKLEQQNLPPAPPETRRAEVTSATQNSALPPTNTEYIAPETRYKTGDLVPPSVTDGTTRQLEINKEGETMALPKN